MARVKVDISQMQLDQPDYSNPAVVSGAAMLDVFEPQRRKKVDINNIKLDSQPINQPKETSAFEDFAKGGGNILTERGLGIIQLLDEASGGNILSPEYREATYKAVNKLRKEKEELGTVGTITNVVADPLMVLPFAKGLKGAKALAATGAVTGLTSEGLSGVGSDDEDRLAKAELGAGVGSIAAPIAGKVIEALASPVQTAKNIGGYVGKVLGVIPENVATFEATGITPTLGDVSGSNIVKRAQNVMKDVPIAGNVIGRGEEKVNQGVQQGLKSAGFDMNLEKAVGGDAAKEGLVEYTKKGKELFRRAYEKFDNTFIAANEATPITSTLAKINEITKRANTPEALDVYLGSTEKNIIQKIQDAVQTGTELTYNDAKLFRTAIGKKLEDYTIGSSEKGVLRELYGSLTGDLRQKAIQQGKPALEAFDRLNSNYNKFITKLDDTVNEVVNKGEATKIFDSIRSGVALPKRTAAIMESLPQKNRDIVRGSLIRELGIDRTMAGQGEFNAARFAGKFKALDPKAQKALLVGLPKDVQSNFMKIVDAASMAGKTSLQGNPSGTARNSLLLATAVGGVNPATMALTAKLIAGGTITAKMMTSPKFIKWLANVPKQNESNIAKYVAKLSSIAASDLANKEDIETYQQQLGE